MPLEKITTQQMDAKGVCAAPDILNGTPAQNKSIFDRMVRELIAPAYNDAVDAIAAIEQTESGIEAAEALRVAAENLRASAETAREQAESGRITAEEARAEAERLRVSAEENRVTAEQKRAEAERFRSAADRNRDIAETQRIAAEKDRASAEAAREEKETGYVAQAEQAAARADEAVKSLKDVCSACQETLENTGAEQVSRVSGEGDTQVSRVSGEGDTQVSRLMGEGETQTANAKAQADAAALYAESAQAQADTAALYAESALAAKAALEKYIAANPGSTVIDPTLSVAGAAAEAAAVGQLKQDLDSINTTVYGEIIDFKWELGAIYVYNDNVLTYGKSTKRIRTKQGETVSLKKDGVISFPSVDVSDSTTWDYMYTLYGTGKSGTIYVVSNNSTPYSIAEDGEYVLSVRRRTETELSSIDELSSVFLYTPPSDGTESGGLVGDVSQLQIDVEHLKNKIDSDVHNTDKIMERLTILDGEESIEWEGKNLVANESGATFTESATSICTKAIYMAKGDKFAISDYNKATLTVAGNIGKDNYEFKSNSSSDVYVHNPGEFYACVKPKSGVSISQDELATLIDVVRAKIENGKVEKLLSAYLEYRVPDFVHGVKGRNADFDVDSDTRYQDIIDWYDQLQACHSSSMSREQYGTSQTPDGFRATVDGSTYPMYAYTITPLETHIHKIILAYGIHGNGPGGDAINGVVGLAYFVRHLLNGYMEHPTLTYIRKYCTVVVMPVLNPWGYQNNSRGNGRNIDLNRNFSYGFMPNVTEPSIELAYFPDSTAGTPEPIVSGSEAFSEAESIAIRDYITQNHADSVFMLEGHSRGEHKVDGSIFATVKNRFLTFVSDTDSTLNDSLLKSAKRLAKKYGGTVNGGTSLEADGQCFRYFVEECGFQAYENECFGCYDNNIKTRGTDMTEIMCEDFVASTIIAVSELLLGLN